MLEVLKYPNPKLALKAQLVNVETDVSVGLYNFLIVGLPNKEVEEAKRDGRFYRAYEPPSKAEIPADLQKIIDRDPKTKAFVATLSRSNINAISFRLTTAKKPETRARRLEAIAAMLKRGERFY